MKYSIILFLTLAACGQAQQKTFEISSDAPAKDLQWFKEAVSAVNDNLGCDQVIAAQAAQVFTSADEGKFYNFVVFSNNASAAKEIAKGAATYEIGETWINPGTGETDIYLSSFAEVQPECNAWAPDSHGRATCTAYAPAPDNMVRLMDIHELGHALGLEHTKNKDDIMFPYIGDNLHAEGITASQWASYVAQLHAAGVVCPQGGY